MEPPADPADPHAPTAIPADPPAPAGGRQGARREGSPRRWQLGGASSPRGWLFIIGAGLAFTATQLLFVSVRMGLSWDETVYVSQVSGHAPAAWFDPARARGVPLLVAPVALLTSSVAALRVYLAIASGAGLAAALWTWRTLRPGWVLGLGGVVFGGLWVAQYYGPQAMPDMGSALGCLAAVGCFARLWRERRGWGVLAGVGISVAVVTLIRPGDAVYLAGPLLAVAVAGKRWAAAAVVLGGLVAGGGEWVVEAYVRFGGVAERLHAAGGEQGGFGLHFALPDELRALNGPTLCRPCTIGYRAPELDLWWLLLPVLVTAGLLAARRAGQLSSALLATGCGLVLAAQYLFMIDYAAPRFLLPAYALLAIPVADGLALAVSGVRRDLRPAMTALVTCVLVLQLVTQHLVLDHEVGGTVAFHDDYTRIAAALATRGVRPPCLIQGVQYIPIAFYAGCASAGNAAPGEPVAVLVQVHGHAPAAARKWRSYRITGTSVLRVNAYVR